MVHYSQPEARSFGTGELMNPQTFAALDRAAEQLVGLPEETSRNAGPPPAPYSDSEKTKLKRPSRRKDSTTQVGPGYAGSGNLREEDEEEDDDVLLLAKAFFDMREYRRAAHALRGSTGKKAFFLRCYATYLVSFPVCKLTISISV
jgi:anaphase-promoting complex subunit 8